MIYTAKITLKEALCGHSSINVPTLFEDQKIQLTLKNIVKPGSEQRLEGHGLPMAKSGRRRGDIIVKFDVEFPDELTEEQKNILAEIL